MKPLLSFFLCLVLSASAFATVTTQNTFFESVVRVYNKGGKDFGTGNCINIDDKYIYILTNKHVVTSSKQVVVQFYKEGHQSTPIAANVIWTAYKQNEPVDMALLTVDKKSLDFTPTVVKFELDDKIYKEGDTVITVGCPEAGWPRAYKGHISKLEGGTYLITPKVEPGQSGSLLLNEDGTKAIGLIAWSEDNYGKAMTAETIQQAALGKNSNYYLKQSYVTEDSNREVMPVSWRMRSIRNGDYDIICRDGSCWKIPRHKKPNDNNPNDNNPNNDQDDPSVTPSNNEGIKIFPTYPGGTNPDNTENTVPNKDTTTPKVDDSRMTAVETRVNNLEQNTTDIKNQIADLSKKMDNKADTTAVVTPGALTDFVKKDDVNNIASGLNAAVKDTAASTTAVNNRIDTVLTTQGNNFVKILQDIKDAETKAAEAAKTTTATIVPPATTTTATTGTPIPDSVYTTIGNTLVTLGIPSGVVLVLGYLFKKYMDTHTSTLLSLLGGLASKIPFQQPPQTGTTTQSTVTQSTTKT